VVCVNVLPPVTIDIDAYFPLLDNTHSLIDPIDGETLSHFIINLFRIYLRQNSLFLRSLKLMDDFMEDYHTLQYISSFDKGCLVFVDDLVCSRSFSSC
jgi:hypothetical protein